MKAIRILFFLLVCTSVVAVSAIALEQKTVSIDWSYDSDITGIAGFRVYNNNVFICETTDPVARTLSCPINLTVEQNRVTMTAIDTNGQESAQSIPINYTYVPPPANNRPVATADNTITNENTPIVIAVLANDIDGDGDALQVIAVSSADHGATTIIGNSISYTPAPDYFGADSFTYDISDGLLTASASVNIVVNDVNDAPSARDMSFSTMADAPLTGRLSAADPENSSLRFILTTSPALGTVEINSTSGEFQYIPTANVNGVDTFGFKVNDGQLDSNIAMVNITMQAVNHLPVADAGPDQTVFEGETVQLNGVNSFDPDSAIASYEWTQIDGPTVLLSDPNAIQPSFESLDLQSGSASLTFLLTVKDQEGLIATDSAIVNITWVDDPPVADAGADQTVTEGDTVMLDAGLSLDTDDGIATYFWEQTEGSPVILSDSSLAQPTFIAPETPINGQAFSFRLTVTDATGLRSQDTVIVNVTSINNPPVANAGVNQNVLSGQTVTLDATGSQDNEDGIAQVRWTQTSGLPATLSDPSAYQPTFVAPFTGSGESTILTFQVLVTDFAGLQSTAGVNIEISSVTSQMGIISDAKMDAKGQGRWISVSIELPTGFSIEEINSSTIVLNRVNGTEIESPLAHSGSVEISDYNRNKVPDLMVKFNKQELFALLTPGIISTITVSGELFDGTMFEQSSIISNVK
ncbi:MAG: hypothetical protein A2511_13520 [Deltaproteobacteria bacterium RIFOXYD12_FULL_50_9]|nr:MAG: hypothetical protein A2511_13520 [Deltaproteobacteria bacterium RIFOXYD12_FULL_50_9]